MKYVILANSNDKTFDVPRQLVEINGERLIERTIRLLKENGVKDILITSYDKRFDNLGAKRYEPLKNDYDYLTGKGYWLNAFPIEIMDEPICFIWGDVYFSDDAIKTIVETDTDSTLFFCSHNNQDDKYIKRHDEPLAYKVVDTKLFIEHIDKVKKLYDEGKTCRHPIVWEVYRSMNGLDINEHVMTNNYVAINDITCDIDSAEDVDKIKEKLGGEIMIKCEVIEQFSLKDFDKLVNIKRGTGKDKKGELYITDTFECDEKMAEYLTGNNALNKVVVQVIEVKEEIPKKVKENVKKVIDNQITKVEEKPKKKKSSKK